MSQVGVEYLLARGAVRGVRSSRRSCFRESGEPGIVLRIPCGWLYCTQGHTFRYDPGLLRTIRSRTGQHSMQLVLCAGIVRNKSRDSRSKGSFGTIFYLKKPSVFRGSLIFRSCAAGQAQEECLSYLILFGEPSLRKALIQFPEHYHEERNHQGKNNVLLFPAPARLEPSRRRGIRCRERPGGLLRC